MNLNLQSYVIVTAILSLALGAFVALVAAVLLLRLYRRQVIHGMALLGRGDVTVPIAKVAGSAPSTILGVVRFGPNMHGDTLDRSRLAFSSLRKGFYVYLVAGLSFAVAVTFMHATFEPRWKPIPVFLIISLLCAWPAIALVCTTSVIGNRKMIQLSAGYLCTCLMSAVVIALGNTTKVNIPLSALAVLLVAFVALNACPSLFVTGVLVRRTRAAQPVLLTISIASVALCFGLIYSLHWSMEHGFLGMTGKSIFQASAVFRSRFGISPFWALGIVGVLCGCTAGICMANGIAALYRAKWINDQTITADATIFVFAIFHSFLLYDVGMKGFLVIPTGFLAYKMVMIVGFRFLRGGTAQSRHLLFLRVFALGRRSERFLDNFSKAWLRIGSINLIAGPDLATSTVKPNEFLNFLAGRLSKMFLADAADVDRGVRELDLKPDPDGRFRINQFFCRDNTWLLAMRRLAHQSEAVLMDLRGFSPERRGCQLELEELLNHVPLERFVIMVDKTTDLPFLTQILLDAWKNLSGSSPNHALADPSVRLFEAGRWAEADVRALIGLLLQSAGTGKQSSPPSPSMTNRANVARACGGTLTQ